MILGYWDAGRGEALLIIPVLGRQRQVNEFKDSLVYRVISRTARDPQRNQAGGGGSSQSQQQTRVVSVPRPALAPAQSAWLERREVIKELSYLF